MLPRQNENPNVHFQRRCFPSEPTDLLHLTQSLLASPIDQIKKVVEILLQYVPEKITFYGKSSCN